MVRKYMRFPGGLGKAVTLSYDDGVQQDIPMIALMKKYGVKGTFNLNSARFITRDHQYPEGKVWRAMIDEDVVPTYSDPICSVATHSAHHPTLLNASEAEIAQEILSDRIALEKLFGKVITGHAIPNGPYDETTIKVGKMCGLKFMRTAKATKSYKYPKSLMPLDPTCAHSNPDLMELTEKFLADTPKEDPFLFYLWGHTYTFEGDNNWYIIEDFMKAVSHKDDIWYATNDEIFDYAEKFSLLECSADGHIVSNPTDTEIWFLAGGKVHSVKSGETIRV
ncbi:MAG: polysaccharide deacetylase family protein [Clostridia bacterium]|nr:polysaccharide deacetylase family protein [Clostridia bacterium]